jgi:hypothetical protein
MFLLSFAILFLDQFYEPYERARAAGVRNNGILWGSPFLIPCSELLHAYLGIDWDSFPKEIWQCSCQALGHGETGCKLRKETDLQRLSATKSADFSADDEI